MDYELTGFECAVIVPLLLNTPLGVARVDDRRAMNGIFWALRTSAPWRALSKTIWSSCHLLQSVRAMAGGGCLVSGIELDYRSL